MMLRVSRAAIVTNKMKAWVPLILAVCCFFELFLLLLSRLGCLRKCRDRSRIGNIADELSLIFVFLTLRCMHFRYWIRDSVPDPDVRGWDMGED